MAKRTLSPNYHETTASAGRSTQMIIDSSSYVITTSHSPPDRSRNFSCAQSVDKDTGVTKGLALAIALLCVSRRQREAPE